MWPKRDLRRPSRRPRRAGTADGIRSGHFAAAECLDNYVFGRVPTTQLSSNGQFSLTCNFCGALHFPAERVQVSHPNRKAERRFTRCCRNGVLAAIPTLPPAPPLLASLLGAQDAHPSAGDFQRNIRAYNGALAFASFSDSHGPQPGQGKPPTSSRGPPVYVLHGMA